MTTIDLKKDPTYRAAVTPGLLDVPEMLFAAVDGRGAPEGAADSQVEFQQAMQILFGIIYAIKFWTKKHPAPAGYASFTLAPIEALWWTASGQPFAAAEPEDWRWTAMIRLPDFVTPAFFREVVIELKAQKKSAIYDKAQRKILAEGRCVQILHIGPYDQEQADINALLNFADRADYRPAGPHHELYFSDPRRTKPDKLRTIIRYPVAPKRTPNRGEL